MDYKSNYDKRKGYVLDLLEKAKNSRKKAYFIALPLP